MDNSEKLALLVVNRQDENGCTSLHNAAKDRSDEKVLKLMRNGKKNT